MRFSALIFRAPAVQASFRTQHMNKTPAGARQHTARSTARQWTPEIKRPITGKAAKSSAGTPERKAAQQPPAPVLLFASVSSAVPSDCQSPRAPGRKRASSPARRCPGQASIRIPHFRSSCGGVLQAGDAKRPEKHRRQSRSIRPKRIHPGRAIRRFIPHAPMPQYPPPEWQECSV